MRNSSGMFVIAGMVALGVGGLPTNANAIPITPSTSAQGNVAFYDGSTSQRLSTVCFTSTTGVTTGCSGTATTPNSTTLNYLTTASADYGVLKAGGQSTNSG